MYQPQQTPPVDTECHDGIWIMSLNRAPVNALNLETAQAVLETSKQADADGDCTALVVTGLPGMFSSGIDTREVPGYAPTERSAMLRVINELFLVLYAMPKPVVVALSGHAIRGGLALALAGDYRVAARGAFKLGLLEAQAGVPFPAGALAVVRAELSPAQMRILASGASVFGPEAPELTGVVDLAVEPRLLLGEAIAEAQRLAALPAFGSVKRQLRGAAIDRLQDIVARDDEPLHADWITA